MCIRHSMVWSIYNEKSTSKKQKWKIFLFFLSPFFGKLYFFRFSTFLNWFESFLWISFAKTNLWSEQKIRLKFELDTLAELNLTIFLEFFTNKNHRVFQIKTGPRQRYGLAAFQQLSEMQSWWWWWWKTLIVEHLWSAKSGYSFVGGVSRSRKFIFQRFHGSLKNNKVFSLVNLML